MTSLTRETVAPPEIDRATQRSRRRFARRQWRRRWLRWRHLLLAVLVLAIVLGTGWLVLFSDRLSVQHVTVEGESILTEQQVGLAADVPMGEQLALVDPDVIANRVAALAAVRSVDVSRAWPDGILVRVTERVPVAVIEIGGRLRGLDADGVVFSDYRRPPPGLPRVSSTTQTGTEALGEAAAVVAALPRSLASRVDHVEVLTVDQVSLVLRDGRTVLWGSSEESTQKAQVLTALLRQPGRTYDVSVPGQPTVRS